MPSVNLTSSSQTMANGFMESKIIDFSIPIGAEALS
jgi:hypothetical protein